MKQQGTEQNSTENTAEVLLDLFKKRQTKNPAYSSYAFARDLGVSQTFISLVLNGKRTLSNQRALEFSERLHLTPGERRRLMDSLPAERSAGRIPVPTFMRLELDRFKLLHQWYHIAILDLTTIKGFQSDAQWIAKKLKITVAEVRDAIARLERLGLLAVEENGARTQLRKTDRKLAIPTERSEDHIRSFHRQMIEKGLRHLEHDKVSEFDQREISGMTMAINSKRIPEAKRRIQQFTRELFSFLSEGACDHLYQFNTQLFPLIDESTVAGKPAKKLKE